MVPRALRSSADVAISSSRKNHHHSRVAAHRRLAALDQAPLTAKQEKLLLSSDHSPSPSNERTRFAGACAATTCYTLLQRQHILGVFDLAGLCSPFLDENMIVSVEELAIEPSLAPPQYSRISRGHPALALRETRSKKHPPSSEFAWARDCHVERFTPPSKTRKPSFGAPWFFAVTFRFFFLAARCFFTGGAS